MKHLITFCAVLLVTASIYLPKHASAQAPNKMTYQAVIRNNANALITNTAVGMQISILQGSANGSSVYVEAQTPTTNANGLVSLEIGSGTPVSGAFAAINWANGPYFIKTETDPTGGNNYSIVGTNELLSVPYALYAKNVTEKTYTIGLWPELGGYVFRVSADGKHGLVAETQDQGFSSTWYNAQNLISVPANHSMNGQKFSDWRMPTLYELNEMYLQKLAIGGFVNGGYWSSTELDISNAFYQLFSNGNQTSFFKTNPFIVRSVRAF